MDKSKEQILDDILKGHPFSMISVKDVYDSMDQYAVQEVKSNSQALVNLIVETSGVPELVNQSPTVGELRDIIKLHAKITAIEFFKWNGHKIFEYVQWLKDNASNQDKSQEKENEISRFELASIETRYQLFLDHKSKQQ